MKNPKGRRVVIQVFLRYAILTEIELLYCKSETSLDPQGAIPLDVSLNFFSYHITTTMQSIDQFRGRLDHNFIRSLPSREPAPDQTPRRYRSAEPIRTAASHRHPAEPRARAAPARRARQAMIQVRSGWLDGLTEYNGVATDNGFVIATEVPYRTAPHLIPHPASGAHTARPREGRLSRPRSV